ncbi:MAG: hypothetical protein VW395_08180, partial [Methylotenera sp.]
MNLILQNSALVTKATCLAMCLGLGLSFSVTAGGRSNLVSPSDKSKRAAEEERLNEDTQKNEGMQQTLKL